MAPSHAQALFLLYCRLQGEQSYWRPYIDVLPRTINTPLFWRDDELEQLRGTTLYGTSRPVVDRCRIERELTRESVAEHTRQRKATVLKSYRDLVSKVLESEEFDEYSVSLDDWMWALSVHTCAIG